MCELFLRGLDAQVIQFHNHGLAGFLLESTGHVFLGNVECARRIRKTDRGGEPVLKVIEIFTHQRGMRAA